MNYFPSKTFTGGGRLFRFFSIAFAFAILASTARAQNCAPPAGMVGWWAAEGNALDTLGNNDGVLTGTAGYAPGVVGQAFNFLAVGDSVSIPTSGFPTGTSDRTMECWVYINSFIANAESTFACYGTVGVNNEVYSFGGDQSHRFIFSSWGNSLQGPVLNTGQWYHVAVTSVGTNLTTLYLDGTNVASSSMYFDTPDGTTLTVGYINGPNITRQLIGEIDEFSIYSRALSSNEIQAIYYAGAAGKCLGAPTVAVQPANQNVVFGTSATLTAGISGAQPMTYQWEFDNSPLPGATNASLTISNAQITNAGSYSLIVSNSYNYAATSNATVNVLLVSTYGNGVLLTGSQYEYTNSVTIKLTNVTGGAIFYTTDGTTPTPGSTVYTAPFVVSNNNTVIQSLGYTPDFQTSVLSPPIDILIPPSYTFSTSTAGGGRISISPTNTSEFSNTLITLTATPSNGWTFLQWLGDVAGTNASNSVILDRNKSVQAVFGTTVSNVVGGNGSVVFNPAGGIYPFGTILQVSAIPQPGNYFVFWGEAASGSTNPLAFPVTKTNQTISALFNALGGGQAALAVVPVGHGTVSNSSPANTYATGTTVTLTATPSPGYAFLGWSGGSSSTNNPFSFKLNSSETIYANFSTNNTLVIYPVTAPGTIDGMTVDLKGELGAHYRLDASTDLLSWTNLYNLTNDTGTIHYIDLNATNLLQRFYRGGIVSP